MNEREKVKQNEVLTKETLGILAGKIFPNVVLQRVFILVKFIFHFCQ